VLVLIAPSVAAHGGERGDEDRTQGGRGDQVGVAGPRLVHVVQCAAKLRILGDGGEEARQAHFFLCA